MLKNSVIEYRLFGKIIFILVITLVITSMGISSSANATTKQDALNAVVNFLNAEKNCNVDEMMNLSEHSQKISNIKEFYTNFCKRNPLQKANITDLSMVNETTALVSIESSYKDRIFISTMPVVNKNGQWKIIRGMSNSGYVEFPDKTNKDTRENEVEKAVNDYSNAIKLGELKEMKKHLKIMPHMDTNKLENHLKSLSDEKPTPEVTTLGINMISDSVAIAQIKIQYNNFSSTNNLVVCKENAQWKIVFGRSLMSASIPTSDKIVEIK
ncbi:nuclear transport factor 2 family protein [Peribacillus loiseleuriae]|uniref:nuclear transport factor 2 family protein n=1 Tax=Peribacillus loiseleuriae TaxID=1679170 RepID=UPI003D04A85A